MRTLITGGAGFIGSHLVDAFLAAGEEVIVLDDLSTGSRENLKPHPRLTVAVGSVTDGALTEDLVSRSDFIYHLAASVGVPLVLERPYDTIHTNIVGTLNVLTSAARGKKPVVLASSSEVYGRRDEGRGAAVETDDFGFGPPGIPRWSYAASKAMGEFIATALHRQRGLECACVRFFNVIGPRQVGRYGMVVPRFCGWALEGKPLQVYGDGRQTRSFTYVGDVVAILRLLSERLPAGRVLNIGSPHSISILDLAGRVIDLAGSSSPICLVPYESAYGEDFQDAGHRVPDLSALEQAIGTIPRTPLDTALREVLTHLR